MTLSYQVKRGLLGKHVVLYSCPACRAELESALDNAGQSDRCPKCHASYVAPGVEERDAMRAKAIQGAEKRDREKEAQAERRRLANEDASRRLREEDQLAERAERERQEQEGKAEEWRRQHGTDGVGLIWSSIVVAMIAGLFLVGGVANESPVTIVFGSIIASVAGMLCLAGVIRWAVWGAELVHLGRIERQNERIIQLLGHVQAKGPPEGHSAGNGVLLNDEKSESRSD